LELTALKDQVAVANQILPERERQVSDLREELQQAIWAANRLRRELREVTAERDHLGGRLDAIAAAVAKYDERNGE
jgi:chromosome segregation ATPase